MWYYPGVARVGSFQNLGSGYLHNYGTPFLRSLMGFSHVHDRTSYKLWSIYTLQLK